MGIVMKSVPKLIRRFTAILAVSGLLLLLLNLAALVVIGRGRTGSRSPYMVAEETASALRKTAAGYVLDAPARETLEEEGAWAILIGEASRRVVWRTENTPQTVPERYSLANVARLTRGYLEDCPTYTGEAEDGLLVLGYPETRYWKLMWPSWDYSLIAHLPMTALVVALANLALVFLIYWAANAALLRSVRPIVDGIRALPTGEPVSVPERGPLSELAFHIDRTSQILQEQKARLGKKEAARANWIAGISHDIRTPLSMVMGCAAQLSGDSALTPEQQKRALCILRQSERMRDLVSGLNLASRLEYNMQPLHLRRENAAAIWRQAAADFVNADPAGQWSVRWLGEPGPCFVTADRELLQRAADNLLQNCMVHNETGCRIYLSARREGKSCLLSVADDGAGVSKPELARFNSGPGGLSGGPEEDGLPHGLGLQLVRQIAAAHGGTAHFGQSAWGGFQAELRLPLEDSGA